jgi:hypothetical protein
MKAEGGTRIFTFRIWDSGFKLKNLNRPRNALLINSILHFIKQKSDQKNEFSTTR